VTSPQSISILPLRRGSEQRDDGIVPFNALSKKYKIVNCVKSPISLGIVEVNKLS
jgi:hypothetical protein